MKEYFNSLPDKARKRLLRLANGVRDIAPTDTGTLRVQTHRLRPETEPKALLEKLFEQTCRGHPYVYYFYAVNEPDLAQIEDTFRSARAREKDVRHYARFNRQSKFLYVGSSIDNICRRFKQHLGYGPKRTYSIQLAHWARDLKLELDFVWAKYPHGTEREVIHALEDTLWDTLSPMFGRKGQR